MKQTAVEWVFDYLWKNHHLSFSDNIFEQAKQMEKDQIQQAWIDGMRSVSIAPFEDEFYKDEAEQYYQNR